MITDARISVTSNPRGDGNSFTLNVQGNYSYYACEIYVWDTSDSYEAFSEGYVDTLTSSNSRLTIYEASARLYVYTVIYPYDEYGRYGDYFICRGTNVG